MIEKVIKYKNFNGKEREKKCLFHLNTAEITDWLSTDGDYTLDQRLSQIIESNNGAETINAFNDLIYRSYGEKSLDGERFMKDPEILRAFVESGAYPKLFEELLSDTSKAIEFFIGILPADFASEVEKIVANMSEESEESEEESSEQAEPVDGPVLAQA